MLEFFDRTAGFSLARKVEKADTFFSRLQGLLGRKDLPEGQGLWLVPGGAVHTCFMSFTIDAVFLDREYRVLRVLTLPPWRFSPWVAGTASVLELPSGAARNVKPQDLLEIKETDV